MHKSTLCGASALQAPARERHALALAVTLVSGLAAQPSHAMLFGSEDGLSGSFDSTLSYGFATRLQSPDCHLLGGDSGGCNTGTGNDLGSYYALSRGNGYANADINFSNADDGNLNYNKHDVFSQVLKGTHELSLRFGDGWSALGRVVWAKDFKMDNVRTTALDGEAERDATERFDLLDLWVAKSFDIAEMPAKVKLGNQVISWGAEIFVPGGINQINALSLPKYHTPGTQLKEVFIPAPMASFNIGITETLSLEGYYQFKWNAYNLDPVGTYFSSADVAGEGRRPIYYSTSYIEGLRSGICGGTPTGHCGAPNISGLADEELVALGLAVPYGGERKAKNSGQYGVALRWTAERINTEFGLFYQRYHDKVPFVGYTALSNPEALVVDDYFINYGEDKDLFGLSMSTMVGPVAVAGELSYRPRDSVGTDPTVPFGRGITGSYNPYSVFDTGVNKGFVEERKWQADLNAIYNFSASDPLGFIPSALGASDGFILAELVVVRYPGLDTSGKVPYVLPDYSLPDRTSWGYVTEVGINYPDLFGSGVVVTPQLDFSHDVNGTAPNAMPLVEGRRSLTTSLLLNYRDRWKGGLQWVRYWGGGDNNLMADRDFLSGSLSYSF
ncbi:MULTISPECIES: DUF1302 domain-containing protein [unclassified Pseudomonas]|uniref:DUF1302 domain-containing protein n=1 Tax=unclassified Pseudomonas TaxID=196821 RepID=UPI000C889345|nr:MULTISPECIES: DUF1302 domain-containing protein [unclassified Pseudomonas]PMZ73233.1 DUF1302 domain-containing protein [Pseudomonas sp. GW247-3R2A]PMY73363.1 DUF1302 domain-containing protein [Pseudomonas sp. MPR-R3A]PMY98043.1 DUF1302 domain-containing protein [Pseudomonas sp. FW305-124]PNA92631.1 DUF1302 domain-containing protein [Pseudomonas sp. FW300-E2]PNB03183.1 DUF1302 domain-containing protein [Pseudomonas sp. MPR-AND1B]